MNISFFERKILDKNEKFAIAEYSSLKNEILLRSKIRHELVKLSITGAGIFIALVTKSSDYLNVLLIYPILVMFLALAWYRNLIANLSISTYIRTEVENKLHGWESYLYHQKSDYNKRFIYLGALSSGGLFFLIQILCLVVTGAEVNIANISFNFWQWTLLFLSGISSIITLALACDSIDKKLTSDKRSNSNS